MNLWGLSASDLLVWGIVLHLIADWPLQNEWMANNKMERRVKSAHIPWSLPGIVKMDVPRTYSNWWDRHPAAYAHAAIHLIFLSIIFWWAAIPLAIAHLIIDTRAPVVWWSKWIGQTQPQGRVVMTLKDYLLEEITELYDVGTEVRFWTDQVFHIACIAVAALLVSM